MKQLQIAVLITFLASIISCGERPKTYLTINGFAQGTTYHIIAEHNNIKQLEQEISNTIDEINNSLSLYNNNSLLSRLNRGETDSLDLHLIRCIEISNQVSCDSDGAYDITIKPVSEVWGFDGKAKIDNPNIDSLMQYVGYDKISIEGGRLKREREGVQINLNAIAQGYTVDLIGSTFSELGIKNYLIELGGEIICRGFNSKGKEWRVGIDKPIDGNYIAGAELQNIVELTNKGLATSGNYRKFTLDENGKKIVHIIDARSGYCESTNLLSATVIAKNATLADAYGTVLMILGFEKSKKFIENRDDLSVFLVYVDSNGETKSFSSSDLKIRDL